MSGLGLIVAPPLRRIARGYALGFDLRGRVAAFVRSGQVPWSSSAHSTISVAHLLRSGETRRCVVADARRKSYRPSGASVFRSPVLTKHFVYWAAEFDSDDEAYGPGYFLRRRIPDRSCRQRGRVQVLRKLPYRQLPSGDYLDPPAQAIAVTGGRVFYTTEGPQIGFQTSWSLFEMTDPPIRDP